MNKKPTIFLTISVGMIARNLLNNRFYDRLCEQYEVVLITPLHDNDEFVKSFGRAGVLFEELKEFGLSKMELFFKGFRQGLIYNQTTWTRDRYGLSYRSKKERTIARQIKISLKYIVFGMVLSRMKFLRKGARWFDEKFFTRKVYDDLFLKYNPVGVFVTNASSDHEVHLVRAAKRHGVHTFGMTKSWDNFSKFGMRSQVDTLMVWSDFMKDEAVDFQDYPVEKVHVTGVPQFDLYARIKDEYTRDDFVKTYGLDPNKKIILFGQEAPIASPDDPYVVSVLADWIRAGDRPYQILIRPHFGHKGSIEAFEGLPDGEVVFLDTINKPSGFKSGHWDFSLDHQVRLGLSLGFSDVVVTSTSTLVLDGIASGAEVLCYAFDEVKDKHPHDSMVNFYETLWFKDLREYGLSGNLEWSEDELRDRVEGIIDGSALTEVAVYDRIRERFCYKVDGESGERIFSVIHKELSG